MTYIAGTTNKGGDWVVRLGHCILLVVFIGAGVGLVSTVSPILAVSVFMTAISLLWVFGSPAVAKRVFLVVLGCLLLGYAFIGRGFAYIRVGPVYVGDVVLVFGAATAIAGRSLVKALRHPTSWLIIIFMLIGLTDTLPYLASYGVDALRDGAIYGYGIYALVVAGMLDADTTMGLPGGYWAASKWFLVWAPICVTVTRVLGASVPYVPGTGVPLIGLKAGEIAVQLAGIATLMVTPQEFGINASSKSLWLRWALWLIGFATVAGGNRGGTLAVISAVFLSAMVRPNVRWTRPVALAIGLVSLFLVLDLHISLGTRTISPQQFVDNFASIWQSNADSSLANSRQWRLNWWSDIFNYTFRGRYFWWGKGFGVNLADADGYQVLQDDALRSPHNAHMTVLARMGVPGFLVWLLLHLSFATEMWLAYRRAARRNDRFWRAFNLWVLGSWAAFLVNATFDVFLEGPQGGIWFWTVVGLGLAGLRIQRNIMLSSASRC